MVLLKLTIVTLPMMRCISIRSYWFHRSGRSLLVLLSLTLIVGCTARSPTPALDQVAQEHRWALHHAQLSALDGWGMGGRIAVKNSEDSWSASLRWEQQAEAFDIRFSSMLGQRIAQLKGDGFSASLYLPDDQVRTAADISDLLDVELGWHVPMDGLRYWVVGLPMPGVELRKGLDAMGRLQWLTQAGWQIEYQDYRQAGPLDLPKKMVLTRGEIRVRLVIDRWSEVTAVHAARDVAPSGLARE